MRKLFFLLVFLFLLSSALFCQSEKIILKEIVVEKFGIHALSKDIYDTVSVDEKTYSTIFCFPDTTGSFWYKIDAAYDCNLSVDIYAEKPNNTYNYFFYRANDTLRIADVKAKRKKYAEKNFDSSGVIFSAVAPYIPNYISPYHALLQLKKGEEIFLNVEHVIGKDCGHRFTLSTIDYSKKFRALYKTCFGSEKKNMQLRQTAKVIPFKKYLQEERKINTATFILRDSIQHKIISGEIKRISKTKDASTTLSMTAEITSSEKGVFELLLEKNKNYHFTFSSVGYKSSDVFFITTDSLRSFTNDVYLTPLKEGDNFVMEKIYFNPNTYAMREGGMKEVDKLMNFLKENPAVNIEIQGHTNGHKRIKARYSAGEEGSFTGSAKKLSQRRAEVIKKYLIDNGISAERISATGYGDRQMIFKHPKNQAEANKNIRVAIQILTSKDNILTKK